MVPAVARPRVWPMARVKVNMEAANGRSVLDAGAWMPKLTAVLRMPQAAPGRIVRTIQTPVDVSRPSRISRPRPRVWRTQPTQTRCMYFPDLVTSIPATIAAGPVAREMAGIAAPLIVGDKPLMDWKYKGRK
jgi:hypothetical protein